MATIYLEARKLQQALALDVERFSAKVRAFPADGPMGLVSDAVRATPEYRAAKADYAAAFEKLRGFNAWFVKTFAKEIREERRLVQSIRNTEQRK